MLGATEDKTRALVYAQERAEVETKKTNYLDIQNLYDEMHKSDNSTYLQDANDLDPRS